MVQPCLQPDPGGRERVVDQSRPKQAVLVGVGDGVVDHRRQAHRIGQAEVRDRLAGGNHRELDLRAGEECATPGAGCDDARAGRDLVTVGAHPHRAVARLDAGHPSLVEHDRACLDGAREERLVGAVGQSDAAVRVKEHGLVGLRKDGPAPCHLVAPESSSWSTPQAASARAFSTATGPKSSPPVRDDELLADLGLELAPALQRTLGESDVMGVGVGEPEDPRGAMARSSIVTEPELLDENDSAS